MCVGSDAQCFILGLNQASAPEDCRLMWPIFKRLFLHGHSVSNAHMHSSTKKNRSKKKPQDVVYTFVYFSKNTLCVFEISLQFVIMPSFLFFLYSLPVSDIDLAVSILFSDLFLLLLLIIFILF